MDTKTPLTFKVIDNPGTPNRELHIDFTQAFRSLSSEARVVQFRDHINNLQKNIAHHSQDDAARQGMVVILQVSKEILPFIEGDEIPLDETVVIIITSEFQLGNLANRGNTH
ncbi:MAG: hypothetical protein GXP09_11490 [Gammaproteobacteria bacterium]|nr:hypothetical protein [Gammaproteobacteria bacterium]